MQIGGKSIFGSGSELIGGEAQNIKLSFSVYTEFIQRLKEKGEGEEIIELNIEKQHTHRKQ